MGIVENLLQVFNILEPFAQKLEMVTPPRRDK